jgi:hypothetical protein
MRLRKLPVEVEAMLFDGTYESASAVTDWMLACGATGWSATMLVGTDPPVYYLTINTLEGRMVADPGDWVIKEPFPTEDRTFYPAKPDIIARTYERVWTEAELGTHDAHLRGADLATTCPVCGKKAT